MHSSRFEGFRGIVTGAAQGIGFTVVQRLLESGAQVLLNDFDQAALEKASRDLDKYSDRLILNHQNASDQEQVKQMVTEVVTSWGGLDFAVANAGLTHFGDFLNYPQDSLKKVLDLNIGGSFFLAQAAANQIIQQQTKGRIILLSSVTAHVAHTGLEAYGMSKAALEMLAKYLSKELGPKGITTNCIAPGATLTPRTTSQPGYEKGWKEVTPTRNAATTDDIATALLFLLSDEARHINGQTLVVDGGWTNTGPLPQNI